MKMFPFTSRIITNNHEIHAMLQVIKFLITTESLHLFYDYPVHQYRNIVSMKNTNFLYIFSGLISAIFISGIFLLME